MRIRVRGKSEIYKRNLEVLEHKEGVISDINRLKID